MLAAAEQHWWYRGRRRILRAELGRLGLTDCGRVLDAGCGSGHTLDVIADHGTATGVDLDPGSVAQVRARGHDAIRAAIEDLPFADGTFGLVTCLDVIEHLDDDAGALRELLRVTSAGGVLLVTVPAYQALWSDHDELNLHKRRYRAATLGAAATRGGWSVERTTYFNTLLLPPAAVVRLASRRSQRPGGADLGMTPALLNPILELPNRAEARLIGSGARLPAGLSLLASLRKPSTRANSPARPRDAVAA